MPNSKFLEEYELDDMCYLIIKELVFNYSITINQLFLKIIRDNNYPFFKNKFFNKKIINFNTCFYLLTFIKKNNLKIILGCSTLLVFTSEGMDTNSYSCFRMKSFIGGEIIICNLKKNTYFMMYSLFFNLDQKYFYYLIKDLLYLNIEMHEIRKILSIFLLIHKKER